jgi:multidrug efflux pump subunit AcrA (membrane-fusion protein)
VTQDAIQGILYGIYYPIPENYSRSVTDKGAIEVEVPVGYFDTSAAIPFVPLDAVYQGEEQASVFVAVDGKAKSKTIELGNIYGRFIEVKSGLQNGDQIILDRTVVDGDTITVQ